MPSYADQMERRRGVASSSTWTQGTTSAGHSGSRVNPSGGPVTIVVSGTYHRGTDGRLVYVETEEEWQGMDVDVVTSDDEVEHDEGIREAAHDDEVPSGRPRTKILANRHHVRTARDTGAHDLVKGEDLAERMCELGVQEMATSLLVIDTNALVNSPAFFRCLFDVLLQLRLGRPVQRPLTVVVPYVVLVELDGLSKSHVGSHQLGSGGVNPHQPRRGAEARAAHHCLLAALQAQRKARPEAEEDSVLEQREWVLHVETRRQAVVRRARMAADTQGAEGWEPDMSADEDVISLAVQLGDRLDAVRARRSSVKSDEHGMATSDTPATRAGAEAAWRSRVFLLSDDTNARLRAEAEGVRTFDLRTVLGAGAGGGRRPVRHATRGVTGESLSSSRWAQPDPAAADVSRLQDSGWSGRGGDRFDEGIRRAATEFVEQWGAQVEDGASNVDWTWSLRGAAAVKMMSGDAADVEEMAVDEVISAASLDDDGRQAKDAGVGVAIDDAMGMPTSRRNGRPPDGSSTSTTCPRSTPTFPQFHSAPNHASSSATVPPTSVPPRNANDSLDRQGPDPRDQPDVVNNPSIDIDTFWPRDDRWRAETAWRGASGAVRGAAVLGDSGRSTRNSVWAAPTPSTRRR